MCAAYLPQESFLFNDTVAANVRYAWPDASEEAMVAATSAACIHDVITSLPKVRPNRRVGHRLRLS